MLDAVGRVINGQSSISVAAAISIDLTALPSGVYFLYSEKNGHQAFSRFVKN
ncbi:MAG: T9SS type A sorting domain-containing protein [Bacteroidota bacterium]